MTDMDMPLPEAIMARNSLHETSADAGTVR